MMSTGELILHILSILGFGILCFAAGMTFKSGEHGIAMVQILIGLTVIDKVVKALINSNPRKLKNEEE